MSNYSDWLKAEEATAEEEFTALIWHGDNGGDPEDAINRAYWEGYVNAMTNALAAYHGPTPLEGGE